MVVPHAWPRALVSISRHRITRKPNDNFSKRKMVFSFQRNAHSIYHTHQSVWYEFHDCRLKITQTRMDSHRSNWSMAVISGTCDASNLSWPKQKPTATVRHSIEQQQRQKNEQINITRLDSIAASRANELSTTKCGARVWVVRERDKSQLIAGDLIWKLNENLNSYMRFRVINTCDVLRELQLFSATDIGHSRLFNLSRSEP